MEKRQVWNRYTVKEVEKLESLSKSYRDFLHSGKTERECVEEIIKAARSHGYRDIEEVEAQGTELKAGMKLYAQHMGKTCVLVQIGEERMENGMQLLGAHLDSPRIDIKQVPLYSETGMEYFDTHYYGGIKKYQWLGIPLAVHGVVVKKDGTAIRIRVGEEEDVLCITDLLPHLGKDLDEKKMKDAVDAEKMDLLAGNGRMSVMEILRQRYGITEEDFLSAELEIVPSGDCKECGLDKSMLIGYGHDDRSCAFAQMQAMFAVETLKRTVGALFVDKEEIGSVGATGMHSRFFENTVRRILKLVGDVDPGDTGLVLQHSRMLSCDVTAAYDPMYREYFESRNSAVLSGGLVLTKYTGSRGKAGANDANAEYLAALRRCFEKASVAFQTAELGAVDKGGGGTIAYIMASYGMEIVDCGIPVLNMHAPWEIISKADLYEMTKGYTAFLTDFTMG